MALAVAVVATGGAVFVGVDRLHSSSQTTPPAAVPAPVRAPVLAALAASAPPPAQAAVAALVRPALSAFPSGERVSGTVVDVATGKTLWSRGASTPQPPASTLKLLTAAAALRTLGPSYRFTTTVRQVGNTVYLVGGGDPTIVESASPDDVPASYPRPASLTDLATQTAARLPVGQPVRLRVDTTAWPTAALPRGWAANYVTEGDITPPSALELDGGRLRPSDFDSPRTADPAGQAADAFVALLRKDGVTVNGRAKPRKAPPAATQIAAVASPPLSALVQRLLTDSDNDLAEALGRALAVKEGQPPTFAGEVTALTTALAPLGVGPGELSTQDSSGLSHTDAVAPTALVSVLRAAAVGSSAVLRPIVEGLPVAGFTGTLSDRYRDKDKVPGAGAGVVRAKTGSLTGVNTLAGLVVDASGRLLAFALLGSGTTETGAVQDALDAVTAGLARLA